MISSNFFCFLLLPPSSLAIDRRLPESIMDGLEGLRDYWNQLLTEPPDAWSGGQWIFAAFLLLTFLWCCGCLGCNCRRRAYYGRGNGGYYGNGGYHGGSNGYGASHPMMGGGYQGGRPYNKSSSGGMGNCIRNAICCFCCYEFFCADCAHVPCFRHSSFQGADGVNAIGDENYTEMV
mmetsp:Transcript_8403/g.12188  ORF Transcript_8403/g.12188 Transcript_8403/m.12188 type:complete len:177 (+) Transcript_8403:118-648(+)|eukprot:CAMPEP_0194222834 /NCGR_PEP_ID=MMETSP0156-20130528/33869_1 /TAXON_ID=33649 /ORGANISM="Thalassionema nitzschioides, Strain L26-B" /LENGTH=176 /DNA_ID=CAMNT_0038953777 /DNA_START=42 /DNA_END=572 /DNA_ORIENTATION=+